VTGYLWEKKKRYFVASYMAENYTKAPSLERVYYLRLTYSGDLKARNNHVLGHPATVSGWVINTSGCRGEEKGLMWIHKEL
jgi:hypothetical protein